MTADPEELLALIADASDHEIEALVANMTPHDTEALPFLLPPDAAAVAKARQESADGLAWLRTVAPEMMPLPSGPQHRALVDALPPDGPAGIRFVEGAFRGAGKSTLATTGLTLLAGVRQSHRFVVIIRETLPEAVSAVRGIRAFLEERPALTDRYPWLKPLPGEAGEIHTAGGMVVVARGAHGAIRGLQRIMGGTVIRPDLVVADDVYDDVAARSDLQTERLQEWLLGTVGGLAGPAGAAQNAPMDVIVIGTTIERGDLITRMLDGEGPFASWRRARYPAEGVVRHVDDCTDAGLQAPTDGPLAVADTEGVVTSIPVPDGAEAGDRVAAWPDGSPLDYLRTLQDPKSETFVGTRVYSREMLLRPRTAEDSLFDEDKTIWVEGLRERILSGEIASERVAEGADPSTGEGDDYTGLVVTALVRLGDVVEVEDDVADLYAVAVLEAHRGRWTSLPLIERTEAVAQPWVPHGIRVAFEANGGFKFAAQELRRRRKVALRAVTADRSKYARAEPMSVWHESRRVLVDASLRRTKWDTEFHSFTGTDKDDHDDLVDATVYGAVFSTSAWRKAS